MKKRILSICLGLLLFVTQFPLAFAANETGILPTSGTCGADGADVTWRITAPGLDGEPGSDTKISLKIINHTGQTISSLYIVNTSFQVLSNIELLKKQFI